MGAPAVEALVARCATAAVATAGADGYPTAALAVVVPGDGGCTLALPDGPIARTVASGAPACVVVDDWPSYHQIQGAILRGTARIERGLPSLRGATVTSFDFAKAAP
ncbi:MAG TPA: pyridoxamine 5'-phosphate oxidase family protein [Mycobacteriales bacterium]|nr:pyridoxamine 5'-phosphate oxidase family protein [Mycobacteriales bacterium]